MRKFIVALTLAMGFALTSVNSPALAQTPALDQITPGYHPTVFNSKSQVESLFDGMEWSFRAPSMLGLNQGSQCYMRAEIWTYDFYRNQNIHAMKAFVFYTHAFKESFKKRNKKKFDWWFHVTPYVLAKNPQTQALEEWTLDATFSETILGMKDWTDLFVDTKRKCAEFVPYERFRCEVEGASEACPRVRFGREHCYLVRVPATIYEPEDIEALQAGQTQGLNWDYSQISESLDKAPLSSTKKYWRKKLGFR